ncbi:MAG: GNAT family N-acetyltransferase [Thermoplasmatota archaeon]
MQDGGCTIERIDSDQLESVRSLANVRLREDYSKELFSHFFENFRGCFLVALEKDEVVGFLLAVPRDETALRILMLAVDENHLGKGIAKKLMKTAEGYASSRKMGSLVLEVGTDNTQAVGFYNRIGFRVVGILQEYYKDRTDAFIMKKILPV